MPAGSQILIGMSNIYHWISNLVLGFVIHLEFGMRDVFGANELRQTFALKDPICHSKDKMKENRDFNY